MTDTARRPAQHPRRLTARTRLTLTVLVLFVVMACLLVVVNYVVIDRLTRPPEVPPPLSDLAELSPEQAERLAELGEILGSEPAQFFEDVRAEARRNVLERLVVSSAIAVAVAALLAWVVAGRVATAALAPVRDITEHARQLSSDRLHQRLSSAGPDDELTELAATFDAMLERLETAFQAHRSFGAYASHELRTPLATLRAEAELASADPSASDSTRDLAALVLRTVDRADQLVSSLLTISRAEAGVEAWEPVDLAAVVGDVVGEHVDRADAAGISVELDLEPRATAATVSGDERLLAAMVDNLVRNAIDYNVPGGTVTVGVRSTDRLVVLDVGNSGPVLSVAHLGELAKPFRRQVHLRASSPGHGLGTSIVASVAALHGGHVGWSPREGGGLDAEVGLPRDRRVPA